MLVASKLNGWQRAWVVLTVVWVIAVAAFLANTRQSEDEIYHLWANDLLAYLVQHAPELKGQSVQSARATYSDFSDRELVSALHKKFLPQHPAYEYGFAEIDSKYESLAVEPVSLWRLAFRWLLIALGVPAVAYVAGLTFVWVREGFRNSKAQ